MACLYFHPNVTSLNFHSAYGQYLQLAFEDRMEVLKAAHDILQHCPDASEPENANQFYTDSDTSSVEFIHVHCFDSHSNHRSTYLESNKSFSHCESYGPTVSGQMSDFNEPRSNHSNSIHEFNAVHPTVPESPRLI
jgi:hypothetical protein